MYTYTIFKELTNKFFKEGGCEHRKENMKLQKKYSLKEPDKHNRWNSSVGKLSNICVRDWNFASSQKFSSLGGFKTYANSEILKSKNSMFPESLLQPRWNIIVCMLDRTN